MKIKTSWKTFIVKKVKANLIGHLGGILQVMSRTQFLEVLKVTGFELFKKEEEYQPET